MEPDLRIGVRPERRKQKRSPNEASDCIQPIRINRYLSNPKPKHTYHGQVGSGRKAGRRGGVEQNRMPTKMFAQRTGVPRTRCD